MNKEVTMNTVLEELLMMLLVDNIRYLIRSNNPLIDTQSQEAMLKLGALAIILPPILHNKEEDTFNVRRPLPMMEPTVRNLTRAIATLIELYPRRSTEVSRVPKLLTERLARMLHRICKASLPPMHLWLRMICLGNN